MGYFLATFVLMLIVIAFMAVGVVFGRKKLEPEQVEQAIVLGGNIKLSPNWISYDKSEKLFFYLRATFVICLSMVMINGCSSDQNDSGNKSEAKIEVNAIKEPTPREYFDQLKQDIVNNKQLSFTINDAYDGKSYYSIQFSNNMMRVTTYDGTVMYQSSIFTLDSFDYSCIGGPKDFNKVIHLGSYYICIAINPMTVDAQSHNGAHYKFSVKADEIFYGDMINPYPDFRGYINNKGQLPQQASEKHNQYRSSEDGLNGVSPYQRKSQNEDTDTEEKIRQTQAELLAAEKAKIAAQDQLRETQEALAKALERNESKEIENDSNQAQATSELGAVDAPNVQVGDIYVVESSDQSNPDVKTTTERKVISNTEGKIVVSSININSRSKKPRTLYFNHEWNLISSRNADNSGFDYSPPLKYFEFPLSPGKTWTETSVETNVITGATRKHTITGIVDQWEEISLPFGSYKAIKLTLKTELIDQSNGQKFTGTDTSWYVPELRRSARSVTSSLDANGNSASQIMQIVKYDLK